MEIHICSITEYDAETRMPTIVNPDSSTFYLVPTEDGTSPDLFTEWVYVNNAWEMFGSASVDLSGYLTDVTVNGNSVVTDGVANVPLAKINSIGVVKIGATTTGIKIDNDGTLKTYPAENSDVKGGTRTDRPIDPAHQHMSTFYGLAKASGDTTQSQSDNPVGTYTDEAKASIQTMLDVPSKGDIPEVKVDDVQINGTSIVSDGVANVPIATAAKAGVVKIQSGYGLTMFEGVACLKLAEDAAVKRGVNYLNAIVPSNQHAATFYGLAKASGDTTQSQSSNAVGNYTEDAKSAISDMLNGAVQISGTDPTINAMSGIRYVCGEVLSLNFTPSANGICDVMFTSGSTPTVLTIPSTIKWANDFDPTTLETNTTYEINIMDGLGAVMAWT